MSSLQPPVSASVVLGLDGIATVDLRDMDGFSVFVCQTRIRCTSLGGASTSPRTELLDDTPFHLRFRVLSGGDLSRLRFDMTERRESRVLRQQGRLICLRHGAWRLVVVFRCQGHPRASHVRLGWGIRETSYPL